MKPDWTAGLINTLRDRVARHNDHAPEGARVKLGEVKRRYSSCFQGESPHDNALQKVDGWLLTKAQGFDPEKHPRAKGGKFAGKQGDDEAPADPAPVALALPPTDAEHQQLQRDSAAYRALTSDVFPTQQYALAGAGLRTGASLLAATAIAASAYRSGGAGFFARAAPWATGKVSRVIAGSIATASGNAATTAAHAAATAFARSRGRPLPPAPTFAAAGKVGAFVADKAEAIGRVPGLLVGKAVPFTIRGAVGFAQKRLRQPGADASRAERLVHAARRRAVAAGVVGGAGLAGGLAVSNAWAGSALPDPEKIGHSIDQYSYRTIEKMMKADGVDLQAAYEQISGGLLDAIGGHALEKSATSFLHDVKWTGIAGALAGIGGAAAGAAVAHTPRLIPGARQYYRDADGKFTSRGNAVTGLAAAAGGIAAAAGAVLAIRRGNAARFVEVARKVLANSAATHAAIASAQPGRALPHQLARAASLSKAFGLADNSAVSVLAQRLNSRAADIQAAMKGDKAYKAALEELDRYGASVTSHYKDVVRDQVNGHLAGVLSHIDAFKIPKMGTMPAQTVGQLRAESVARSAGGTVPFNRVYEAVSRMSPDDKAWHDAIAGLSDAQKAAANKIMSGRQAMIDGVDDQLAAHRSKLEKAAANVETHKAAFEKATSQSADANATAAAATGDEEQAAAAKVAFEARTAALAADANLTKAKAAHEKLKGDAKVLVPIGANEGKVIPKPDVDGRKALLRQDAEATAVKKVDSGIEKARAAALEQNLARHDRMLAAVANLGGGAAPRDLQNARDAVSKSRGELVAALDAHARADTKRIGLEQTVKDLKAARRGKSGASPEEKLAAADLLARGDQVVREHLEAQQDVHKAAAAIALARHGLHTARTEFDLALQKSGKHQGGRRIPLVVGARLSRSFRKTSAVPRAAITRFLASPTGNNLSAFAKAGVGHVKSTAGHIADIGKASLARAFLRETGNPARPHSVDFMRAIGSTTLLGLAGGAVADFGHDLYGYGKAKAFGDKDKRAGARFPKQIKFEETRDPFTGAGWRALSIADPETKGERIVLGGETFDGPGAKPTPIYAGSKLSAVRVGYAMRNQRFGNGGQQGGQRANLDPGAVDIASLPNADKAQIDSAVGQMRSANHLRRLDLPGGGKLEFRREDDSNHDGAAGKLYSDIRVQPTQDEPVKRAYFDKLIKLLYTKQSPVLKTSQAYNLLTGYRENGSKLNHKGVFKANEGFASSDKAQVVSALNDEVNRAVDSHQIYNDHQRAALLRAVALVADVKKLDGGQTKQVRDKILAASAKSGGAQPGAQQNAPAPAPESPRLSAATDIRQGGRGWDRGKLRSAADHVAKSLASENLGFRTAAEVPHVAGFVEASALAVNAAYPELSLERSLKVVRNAVVRYTASAGEGEMEMMRDAVMDGEKGFHSTINLFDQEARRELDNMNKMFGPGIMETLEKGLGGFLGRFTQAASDAVEGEARVPSGSSGGGEFSSGGQSQEAAQQGAHGAHGVGNLTPGQRLTNEVADGTVEFASKPSPGSPGDKPGSSSSLSGGAAKASDVQSWYNPSRLLPEIGSYLTGDAAAYAARLALGPEGELGELTLKTLLPKIAASTQTGENVFGQAARKALRFGAIQGTNAVASRGASAGIGAATTAITGQKAQAPEMTLGEDGAAFLGNLVGGIAGGAAGSGIGSVLTGSLGAYAGSKVAVGAYDGIAGAAKWFSGYDQGQAKSVLNRYTAGNAARLAGNRLAGALPTTTTAADGATPKLRPAGVSSMSMA